MNSAEDIPGGRTQALGRFVRAELSQDLAAAIVLSETLATRLDDRFSVQEKQACEQLIAVLKGAHSGALDVVWALEGKPPRTQHRAVVTTA